MPCKAATPTSSGACCAASSRACRACSAGRGGTWGTSLTLLAIWGMSRTSSQAIGGGSLRSRLYHELSLPTMHVQCDRPHKGNLFGFLYRPRRSISRPWWGGGRRPAVPTPFLSPSSSLFERAESYMGEIVRPIVLRQAACSFASAARQEEGR